MRVRIGKLVKKCPENSICYVWICLQAGFAHHKQGIKAKNAILELLAKLCGTSAPEFPPSLA